MAQDGPSVHLALKVVSGDEFRQNISRIKLKLNRFYLKRKAAFHTTLIFRYRSVSGVLRPERLFKRIPTAQENHLSVTGDGKVKLFPSFCSIFGIKWKADPCCCKQNATLLQQERTLVFEHKSDYKKHVSYNFD